MFYFGGDWRLAASEYQLEGLVCQKCIRLGSTSTAYSVLFALPSVLRQPNCSGLKL